MSGYAGQPVERLEDDRLLRGAGRFVDDITLPDMLHAAILRSPVAHGRLGEVNAEEARVMAGVVAVFTGEDLAGVPPIPFRLAPLEGVERFLQPVIASEKVRYAGEPIAVVIATSPELAEDALEAISAEIEPVSAVIDWAGAAQGDALLFEENGTNIAARYRVGEGDTKAAFAGAAYRRRETLRCQRQSALPMETRGLVADWNAEAARLTVWGSTKVLWFNRKVTATALGLDLGQVVMRATDIGGSFGVRGEIHPEDILIPWIAHRLGRPVKWIEDRREHLMAANHSREVECELEIACSAEGRILGLRAEIRGDMGAYTRTNGGIVPTRAALFLTGPYRVPAVGFEVVLFHTNKTPVGTYRGPGRFEANFFRERIIDIVAADLGIDAAEFRRRNLLKPADLPYSPGKLVPYEAPSAYDSGDYPGDLERVLKAIGYDGLAARNGVEVNGRRHGVGLCSYVESSGAGPYENARLVLEEDGRVSVHTGCTMVGQGLRTALTQLAADALGLPLDRVTVHNASTDMLEDGLGTFASRSTMKGGNAIVDGARHLGDELAGFAADLLGRGVNDLRWQDGAIRDSAGTELLDLPRLAGAAAAVGRRIEARGTFSDPGITYSYGTHAAHVAVDPATGMVEVLDYYATEDAGFVVNPLVAHGQLIGGVVQGLGGVFLDHLVYDAEGQLLTGTLADYLVPTATDYPAVRGETYGEWRALTNPLGIKGAGEGGIVGVAGAVANAVAAALRPLGVTITTLPLAPASLWHAIGAAKARRGE